MTETQDKTPAAEAQQDVTQANEANVETAATAAPVDELSEETLDEVAGGGVWKTIVNSNFGVSNSG
jgi:hypothetical protein